MAQRIFWLLLLLFIFVRFFFYYSYNESLPSGRVRVKGTISSEPLLFDRSERISVQGYSIYIPLNPRVFYGDYVVVDGMAQDGVIKKGNLVEQKASNQLLYTFRKRLLDFYESQLPTQAAALVSGAVIGAKQLLTSDFWNILTKTGTAHVVVASGMNVAIISKFFLAILLLFLPRKRAIPFAIFGVWAYASLAGLGAPIIRAAIMGTLTFVAQELGKLHSALHALFITSTVMLLAKPEWLTDTSFLLTFAATLSIMLFSKPIEQKLSFVPKIIKNDFSTSLAASVGVTPILWWNFGQINLLSPFINALILWTIAPITLLGAFAGIVGLLLPVIGKLLLYLIYPLAWWFIEVVTFFS